MLRRYSSTCFSQVGQLIPRNLFSRIHWRECMMESPSDGSSVDSRSGAAVWVVDIFNYAIWVHLLTTMFTLPRSARQPKPKHKWKCQCCFYPRVRGAGSCTSNRQHRCYLNPRLGEAKFPHIEVHHGSPLFNLHAERGAQPFGNLRCLILILSPLV